MIAIHSLYLGLHSPGRTVSPAGGRGIVSPAGGRGVSPNSHLRSPLHHVNPHTRGISPNPPEIHIQQVHQFNIIPLFDQISKKDLF